MCGVLCIATTTATTAASGETFTIVGANIAAADGDHDNVDGGRCSTGQCGGMLPLLLVLPMLLVPLPLFLTLPRLVPTPPTARRNLKVSIGGGGVGSLS